MGETNGISKPVEVSITDPTDAAGVSSLIEELSSLGKGWAAGGSSDEDIRLKLLSKARALRNALETPRETMIRHCYAQVCNTVARFAPQLISSLPVPMPDCRQISLCGYAVIVMDRR